MSSPIPHGGARHAAATPAAAEGRGGSPTSCGLTRPRGTAADTLSQQVASFNMVNPVNTAGFLLRDNGQVVPTKVTAPAVLFAGHVTVACFEGLRGFYSIDRFTKGDE